MAKFTDINRSLADRLWDFLNQEYVVQRMKIVSEYKITAVEGIPHKDYLARFGDVVREDRVKQLVGYLVKQILTKDDEFEIESKGATIRFGDIFSRGSKYRPSNGGQFGSPDLKSALK